MPRFHFHVFNGKDLCDKDGTELRYFMPAEVQAIRHAGDKIPEGRGAHRDPYSVRSGAWKSPMRPA